MNMWDCIEEDWDIFWKPFLQFMLTFLIMFIVGMLLSARCMY